jgi:hypothetical protein
MSTRRHKKPSTFKEVMAKVKTPETSVTLCLDGPLVAEYERLSAQLEGMSVEPTNLAGDSPGRDLAQELVELREQMLAHQQVFVFRAVTPRGKWRAVRGKEPVKEKDHSDDEYADIYHAWVCEVVAASAADPVMTGEEVQQLADELSNGQWTMLANAAWAVNDKVQGVPFSVAASVLFRSSGARSRQPEPLENPAHASLVGSPEPSPSTSTTPTDG